MPAWLRCPNCKTPTVWCPDLDDVGVRLDDFLCMDCLVDEEVAEDLGVEEHIVRGDS